VTILHPFDALNGQQYISLTTYRKTGEAVPTPVWFAREGERLVVMTLATSGKAKRIRSNGRVTIAPCDARGTLRGDEFPAQARILSATDNEAANRLIHGKYGFIKRLFDLMQRGRERAYIEITPA